MSVLEETPMNTGFLDFQPVLALLSQMKVLETQMR